MEKEYLDEPKIYGVKGMGSILERFKSRFKKDVPTKAKRGGLNEVTELRAKTAKLLGKDIGQVYGLTRGWSKDELRDTLKTCEGFVNPPALWWKLYQKNKDIYGRKSKRDNPTALHQNREKGRKEKCDERQSSLF